ncbi:hypothetical protein [Jeotgalibacillus sp. R-1-5s-1]|uniref:hypothetical protein n=1 Tax=Jeotgalibacillus sp. R-1-5s-1 TaxID=2555897 RepID=UPI00106B42D9|nr:hypothetical protein [Jeotgalibacillus sp. R-1-5s-1]TFD94338.1 hypothetical protein E2491_12900 [Jeotgalibacillus sp. R-1-5s-1]
MKKIVISLFIFIVVIAGMTWFQLSGNTTFGEVLNENISGTDDITHIILESRINGETLWARINDRDMINQLIADQSTVSLNKQFGRNNELLDYTMTIHTGFNSYFFDFDDGSFIGGNNDYKVMEGSFVEPIIQLGDDVEWVTGEEFLSVD